ncbi:MAG: adenylate/guanylate cyclase domain-containing protein [Candidatus Cloacimonas sp.]|jgi:adenylate cyclase|nr:adenylate/guanylate cyclase domain-containing protein [Candidatus Cloacimonas sp.]
MRYGVLLYILVVLLFVKIVFLFPFFDSLEYKTQDSMFRFRGKQIISDQLAIIAIDDASFSALNETWPFPREYHAKLIENLTRAGVKQILFDLEFTENSNPLSDQTLAESAALAGNVIFAGKVIYPKRMGEPSQRLEPIAEITDFDLPWGCVNMNADSDGVIRQYNLFETYDGMPVYSIGIAALGNARIYQPAWREHIKQVDNHLHVAGKSIPFFNHNRSLINYHGPAGTFRQYSYASILDDSTMSMPGYQGAELDEFEDILRSGELAGKTVLVGATIDELHDKFPSPFGGEWMPGVEIHANFLEMANSGKYLRTIDPWLYLMFELALLLLLWFLFKWLKPQLSALALLVLLIAQFASAFMLFIHQGMIIPIVQTAVLLLAVYVASILSHYFATMKEKRFIRSAFQQYMAPELVNQLLQNPKNLTYGGSLQEISVLFTDIRSFTTYSESHTPQETVNILHEYLTEMVKIIIDNQGILDKFVGDEIMALFGTPIPLPNHALNACKVALQMRERLTEMQAQWKAEGREPFEIGLGINTGMAVVGNLGSQQIFDYTAIGDTINLGARLEGINKEYDTPKHIIISEFTYEKVKDMVDVNYLDEVKVKGKNKAVKIYELLGIRY